MSSIPDASANPPFGRRAIFISLGLSLITFLTFLPVLRGGFTDFDDPEYVSNNPPVQEGLSWTNVHWAWTTTHAGYWQPLSWLSLMLDATISGKGAAGFHRTNLILHAISAGVAFLVLSRLTQTTWRAALIAALYALHPISRGIRRVGRRAKGCAEQSVRLAHDWRLRRLFSAPNPRKYLLVLIPFVLGLLSKPMIVTIPCLLLLLDYWPLRDGDGMKIPANSRGRRSGD